MGNNASHSHNHIRIVPASDIEDPATLYDYDEYDDWVPTYQSSSFLHPAVGERQTQPAEEPQATTPKTFADMARRIRLGDHTCGSETSAQAPTPAPAPGIVRFQASRKGGESSWRSSRPSGPQAHSSEQDDSDHLVAQGVEQMQPPGSAPDPVRSSAQVGTADLVGIVKQEAFSRAEYNVSSAHKDTDIRPFTLTDIDQNGETSGVGANVNEQYTELFGKLPDPIRLHEQTGEFDGQVIFIGHPNRDVSAHQWSANSFQWVNIGRYAHARGRVEGSLASDQVHVTDVPFSALAHFKLAAKDREKVVLDAERHEEVPVSFQPILPNVARVNSGSSPGPDIHGLPYGYAKTASPDQSRVTIRKEPLDDPFVVQAQARLPHSVAKTGDAKGSLNFEYKFPETGPPVRFQPRIPTATAAHARESTGLHLGARAPGQYAHSSLREIDVGEEASSYFPPVVGQSILPRRVPDRALPDAVGSRSQLTSQLTTDSEYLKYLDARGQGRGAISRLQGPQLSARSLFPPPGLTVANPHRDVTRLAATSLANLAIAPGGISSKDLDLAGSAPDVDTSTTFQYSDADVIRQVEEYEIVSGLSQQPPTVQDLKGPFFTASKPTPNDPTASLSVHVSEEETLRSWFNDGHRPARQREYAMTLVSAASNGSKNKQLGAIGTAKDPPSSCGMENTRSFVRLYETLAEYVEEYKNGSGDNYFNRAWKPAPAYLRDLGPDGNNSFFSK